jgi:hypothetical protein
MSWTPSLVFSSVFGRLCADPSSAVPSIIKSCFLEAFTSAFSSSDSHSPAFVDAVCSSFVQIARTYPNPNELIPTSMRATILPRIKSVGSSPTPPVRMFQFFFENFISFV